MDFIIQALIPNLPRIIMSIILIAYFILLYRITGRNRNSDKLLGAFALIALLGIAYHIWLFSIITQATFMKYDNLMSRLLFSIQYSLEMFLANTIIFKGEVLKTLEDNTIMFQCYLTLYFMAIMTSGFSIFHFLSRRFHNWFWLTFHKPSNNTHIFIGINDASLWLAKDIMSNIEKNNRKKLKHPKEQIIFIDLPDQQDNLQGISIWDIIARFFKDSKDTEKLSKYIVLRAGKGIDKITKWLERKESTVYILSDNQALNISILEDLWKRTEFKCKIYCHAKKEGLINKYDNITDVEDRVRFVDSSYLAVISLKTSNNGEMLPVKYVDIAEAPDTKNKLGYVTSAFNCAIIGFGETGKEALKFLYEFGAFPDKNNEKSPFKCHIFDNNLSQALGDFGVDLTTLRSPVAKESEFELHPCAVNTIKFREEMCQLIKRLNYIVICLGNDNLNMETALNILEYTSIEGRNTKNKFCIAIKQANTNTLNQATLNNANVAYNNCIHPFGLTEKIWKMDFISNKELDSEASSFYESYKELSDILGKENNEENEWKPSPTWDEREKNGIRSKDYKKRCKARRQKAQDYSNIFHQTTKRMLCEPHDKLAELILSVNVDTTHCKEGDTTTERILEHLAVCEHLRWEASHMLMGYRPTKGDTDDLKKLHCCIKPYNELDETTKHYDWLVVKNSLSDLKIQNANPQETIKDKYIPNPISTNDVTLSSEILELSEKIAENVHEVWAQSRIAEGWTYGPQRDDTKKEHPCLVPYNELPEIEKEYDRHTSQETLKVIMKLGFKIK